MPDSINLRFSCKTDSEIPLSLDITDSSLSLLHHDAVCFKREFIIKIPEDFPCCSLIFELTYTLPQAYPEPLGKRKIPVKGSYTLENPHLLKVNQIHTGLPKQVVILLVEPDSHLSKLSQNTFKLRGWSHWGEQLNDRARPETIVSVAELQQRAGSDPIKIISLLSLFSGTFPEKLTRWLCALHEKYAEQLCVIIVDNTQLEIPWEMFEIKPGQYLGAIARVVRWLPFRRYTEHRWLKVEDSKHSGPTIAYLDKDLGSNDIAAEQEILQKLTIEHFCETLEDLEQRLIKPLDQIGLIYVGCHGQSGMKLFAGGARQRSSDKLRSINLETMYRSSKPDLIAFINACDSARILKNNDIDPSNFVDAFMTHCASGYIGTLTGIDIQKASIIGRRILEAATQPEGIQVAEILRVLRAEAVEVLKNALPLPKDEKSIPLSKVIDTFMYVYYGNPLARLHLYTPDQRKDGA